MTNYIVAAILFVLSIWGLTLMKAYFVWPLSQLKRRTRSGDKIAEKLHKAAVYGHSLTTLLWLVIVFSSAACYVLIARALPFWAGLLIIGCLIYTAFLIVPNSPVSKLDLFLAKLSSPVLARLFSLLHPALSKVPFSSRSRQEQSAHTRLYDELDLEHLLKKQLTQPDSQISQAKLKHLLKSLKLSNEKVSTLLRPRDKLKVVAENDTIGPVLIDEIHKSKQPFCLVENSDHKLVGYLAFSKLDIKSQGRVSDIMSGPLLYLNTDDTAYDALVALAKASQPVLAVVNNFKEIAGVLTLEDIVRFNYGEIKDVDIDELSDIDKVADKYTQAQSPDNTKAVKAEA